MEKFFYFRSATNEDADLLSTNSVTIPVKNITAIGPAGGVTVLDIWYTVHDSPISHNAQLTVTAAKLREVTAELVALMNSGPHSDGFIVIADLATTTDGATSIQGNNVTVAPKFASSDITSVLLGQSGN